MVIVISLFTAGTGSAQEQRQAKDREANRERIPEGQRAYYRANIRRILECRRLHRQTHRERIRKSSRDITIHVGESASKFKDGTRRTTENKFVNTANDIAIHVGDVSWVRVCSKAWQPMPVRCMSLIRQVADGSYVSTGSGLLRLPT